MSAYIYVISTIINGNKNFISKHLHNRSWDKKIIVSYTSKPEEHKEFESKKQAIQFLERVANPCDRKFKIEKVASEKNHVEEVRKCRVCGCTDTNCSQCIEKSGEPCYWVENDLCSACTTMEQL